MKKIINILCALNVSTVMPISLVSCSTHHNESSNKTNKGKLKRYIEEMEENLIFNDLDKNGIDGSQVEDIKLKNAKLTDFLVAGKNTIKVSFKIHGQNKIVSAHINNVQSLKKTNNNISENEAKETIVEAFTKGIAADNLYGWNTIFDALTYFQNEAKKINPNAHIKFSNEFIVSKLGKKMFEKLGKEEINLKKVASHKFSYLLSAYQDTNNNSHHGDGQTIFPLKQIFSAGNMITTLAHGGSAAVLGTVGVALGWASAAVAAGTAAYFLTTWITKKIGDIKRTQEAFLMKNSEKFELEIFFGNNLKQEFTDSSDINNDNKFKFQATLNGIKPRSRENAKKIIESEVYEFNHALTFKEALVGVEQHIKATMFPTILDPNSKHQFELRTDLKDRKQSNHVLKKGLNEIATILKPQKTNLTNIFKRIIGAGNINVIIKVIYRR